MGTTCTISPTFTPTTTVSNVATVSVNTVSTTQTISLQANGANPEVLITLTPLGHASYLLERRRTTACYCWRRGHYRDRSTVHHRRSHAHGYGHLLPMDRRCSRGRRPSVCNRLRSRWLSDGHSERRRGTPTTMPALATGLVYTVSAVYNGDTNNSTTTATPIVLTVAPELRLW